MKKETWIRILSVVAVIVVVLLTAAIVIPNLLRVHITDGGPPGPSTVRTLMTAEIQYQTVYGHYATNIQALGGEECQKPTGDHACLMDSAVVNSSPTHPHFGYYYGAKLGSAQQTYIVWGIPLALHQKSYCGVDDGVLRVDASGSFVSVSSYSGCRALPPVTN